MKTNTQLSITKLLCLFFPLWLSACHLEKQRVDADNMVGAGHSATDYIDPTKNLFPMANYPQSVEQWLPPDSSDVQTPVLDAATQQRYFAVLKSHYFGLGKDEQSPWNASYITSVLHGGAEKKRDATINQLLARQSLSWGSNFKMNPDRWKEEVRNNAQTTMQAHYLPAAREIAIRETLVRVLPTDDPAYDDPRKAGQGYPFDTLQMSSIRAGAPAYVLAQSNDKRWKYVISPSVTGWVHSEDLAYVEQAFINEWVSLAQKQMGAFIKEPVSVYEGDQYYFTARPGTILPFKTQQSDHFLVAVPVRNVNGAAQIRWVTLKDDEFAAMPWEMTPRNIAILMKSMSGRTYGWGNYNFYNDCSAELRSLFMPFGIFLPRFSGDQIQAATRVVDLSQKSIDERIDYLKEHGKPFTTLIYIPGHIMLYIGNSVIHGQDTPMTYQNLWGLRPSDSSSRSIVGGTVFFPLLSAYPENPKLVSLADRVQFKLGFFE
ncbi:MAG: SH3 domain-containing protein [Plesiomonas sp.]|uniref:SH3 domain-containing protein n=1 Tax=Plesiomonas sp. TaxID=2486279 RepID=UPI003F3437B3